MFTDQLLSKIEKAAEAQGVPPSTICKRAVGASTLYRRLKSGQTCTLTVAEKVAEFIEALSAETSETAE